MSRQTYFYESGLTIEACNHKLAVTAFATEKHEGVTRGLRPLLGALHADQTRIY